MDYLYVALRDDFVLGQSCAAAGAPGHYVSALVDQALLVARLEEVPDHVVVLVGLGVVGVVPVHPVSKPFGLLGYRIGESVNSSLAQIDELADPKTFDVSFGSEAKLFFDFYFYPEPLPVISVLKPLLVALHIPEPQEEVFIRTAPGVVDSHGVVGRDGAVDEGVRAI